LYNYSNEAENVSSAEVTNSIFHILTISLYCSIRGN